LLAPEKEASKRISLEMPIHRDWPNMSFSTYFRNNLCTTGIVIVVACSLVCSTAVANETKRVMLLHSFGREFKPWRDYGREIRTELERKSPWSLDITDFSLVSARHNAENTEVPFVEYLGALFARHPPDLIISIGAPAAAFVQRHRSHLFPLAPMLFTVVEQRRVRYTKLTDNDAVVAVAHDFPAVIRNILQVLPMTKHVLVVNGNSPLEKFWLEDIKKDFKRFESKVEFIWTNELSFDDLLARAAALPPHSAIFWHLMLVDGAGVVHEGDAGLARLYAVANAPIFSYADTFFGQGIVGGPMHSVREGSQLAAAVAIRILSGEKAGDIKVPPTRFAAPIFDWRELHRWGISESNLPPGSKIFFRDPTAWERYRWQIVTIAAVFLIQAALIFVLFYEHRRRRSAELNARQRMSELAHMNRQATAGEMSASIAHELNQPLGAILSNTEALEMILDSSSPNVAEIKEILADIKRDDRRASEVIRRLRSLLKKSAFETREIDLNETISEVFDFVRVQASARNVTLNSFLAPQSLCVKADRIQLQQVILNLIINGVDATANGPNGQRKVTGSTARLNDSSAEVSISDSGSGIPADKLDKVFEPFFTTKEHGMGMGLSIARTIIEAHGGRIWAENRPEGGTSFRLTLPLATVH
jgi:signal transduction histidine kinase